MHHEARGGSSHGRGRREMEEGKAALLYRRTEVWDGSVEGRTRRQVVGEGPGSAPRRCCRPAAARPRREQAGDAYACGQCRTGERWGAVRWAPATVLGGAVKYV
jgi:hypothetical protein